MKNISDPNNKPSNLNVLFVEDDPNDTVLCLHELEKFNYRVQYDRVEKKNDFIELAKSKSYDIIISDYGLPDWTGIDALELLKEMGIDTPFILVTGTLGDGPAVDCIRRGVTDYVLKENLPRLPHVITLTLDERKIKKMQKQTDVKLTQAYKEWELMFDSMSDSVSIHDKGFKVTRFNKSFSNLFSRDDFSNKKCYEIFHGQDKPLENCPLLKSIKSTKSETIEFFEPHLDRYLLIRCDPMLDDDGNLTGTLHSVRDITEQKQADIALKESEEMFRLLSEELELRVQGRTKELEDLTKELEAFTYTVSHDLRAPLRHIIGFVKIIMEKKDELDPEVVRNYLNRIQNGAVNMDVLIKDLLNLSRIGQKSLDMKMIDLNKIVKESTEELKSETKDRNIEWKIDKLPDVMCDPILMKNVIINLLSNAVKFTKGREHAVIEMKSLPKNKPGFIIKDNGIGFDMKHVDKMFNVFQRLNPNEEYEGSGIGLAIVKRIISKHTGHIWAEGEPDKGATFYVEIPTSSTATE